MRGDIRDGGESPIKPQWSVGGQGVPQGRADSTEWQEYRGGGCRRTESAGVQRGGAHSVVTCRQTNGGVPHSGGSPQMDDRIEEDRYLGAASILNNMG